jgi:signal transduction histidine kinase
VAAVVATVAKRLEALAIKKGVTIVVDLEKAFSIIGNKTALERMIENVVHNAIKFSHEKGEIKILVTDKSVVISDSGIGMSVKDQSQVFERFYTADSSRNEFNKQGVGLGLSIVRQIAALHNVAVSVDSEQGRGTTVHFTFLQ